MWSIFCFFIWPFRSNPVNRLYFAETIGLAMHTKNKHHFCITIYSDAFNIKNQKLSSSLKINFEKLPQDTDNVP